MKANEYHRTGAAIAAFLMTAAIYCWLNILAPNGPVLWYEAEIALPLEYPSTEFPTDIVNRLTRQTAVVMHIKYDPTIPLPRIFIIPIEDMHEIFGKQVSNGVYFHHKFMLPKIFVTKKKYDHLTGRDLVRGILKYLSDVYPDEFDIRRIPFLERRLTPPLQKC